MYTFPEADGVFHTIRQLLVSPHFQADMKIMLHDLKLECVLLLQLSNRPTQSVQFHL